jgi:hypothetical protein
MTLRSALTLLLVVALLTPVAAMLGLYDTSLEQFVRFAGPVIGAGTWAQPGCAVSATGWGEFFIRLHIAADVCARVAYRGDGLAEAAGQVIGTESS